MTSMQPTDQPKTAQPPPPPPPRTADTVTEPREAPTTGTATGAAETTTPHAKPGVGEKLKGAVHVVHGAGEGLRGSILGAFDTMRGKDVSQTESGQIAGKGREELHKGVEKIRPGHYARKGERGGAAPTAQAHEGQAPLPQHDEAAAGAGAEPRKDVPYAPEEKPPLAPQHETFATGASGETVPTKDTPQAPGSQPTLPPLQREEATVGGGGAGAGAGTKAEIRAGGPPGESQALPGVRDSQSAPGYGAASQAGGQGVSQQGSAAGDRGPPRTTTGQQS